jgi:hypothetical protein
MLLQVVGQQLPEPGMRFYEPGKRRMTSSAPPEVCQSKNCFAVMGLPPNLYAF